MNITYPNYLITEIPAANQNQNSKANISNDKFIYYKYDYNNTYKIINTFL